MGLSWEHDSQAPSPGLIPMVWQPGLSELSGGCQRISSGYSQLHVEFKATLKYRKSCLQTARGGAWEVVRSMLKCLPLKHEDPVSIPRIREKSRVLYRMLHAACCKHWRERWADPWGFCLASLACLASFRPKERPCFKQSEWHLGNNT